MDRVEFEKLSRQLVDQGRLVEAGFASLQFSVIDRSAPPMQIEEMRMAFFAGAQHLFASIMTILDPGDEPSAADMRRMDCIHRELSTFAKTFELRAAKTGGQA